MKKDEAQININLEGVTFEQARRCELIIRQLFEAGIFSMKSGKAILHFDKDGMMAQVDLDYVKWRRNELSPYTLDKIYNSAKIEIVSQTPENERAIY